MFAETSENPVEDAARTPGTPEEASVPAAAASPFVPGPSAGGGAPLDSGSVLPVAATPAAVAHADGLLAPPDHPIRLPAFEGPLDLLLYLIRKNEIDIYDIPIETVTRQYLEILRTTERDNLEVAGEFFVMAATLMYIKSRMLLPPDKVTDDGGDADEETQAGRELDPRWELVSQLIQYKKIKECADHLAGLIADRQAYLPRLVGETPDDPAASRPLAPGDRIELWNTFNRILERLADRLSPGEIKNETTTITSRMEDILGRLGRESRFAFSSLIPGKPTVAILVSTFLACLELARLGKLYLTQGELFDEIYCDADPPPIPPEAAVQTLFPGRERFLVNYNRAEAALAASQGEASAESEAEPGSDGEDGELDAEEFEDDGADLEGLEPGREGPPADFDADSGVNEPGESDGTNAETE
ncbi:MAG: segregation/condensation protein A [Puniceicoccales bacterium]|jgi:segregation and condensation protein A|nr:segregation/condensation protein A [Puniceicoccales bacterium]